MDQVKTEQAALSALGGVRGLVKKYPLLAVFGSAAASYYAPGAAKLIPYIAPMVGLTCQ